MIRQHLPMVTELYDVVFEQQATTPYKLYIVSAMTAKPVLWMTKTMNWLNKWLNSHIAILSNSWNKRNVSDLPPSDLTAQIAKALGSSFIRHRPGIIVSDQYLIDVYPRTFAIWEQCDIKNHNRYWTYESSEEINQLNWFWETSHVFAFSTALRCWGSTDCWNFRKTRIRLNCMVNIMAANDNQCNNGHDIEIVFRTFRV